MSRKDRVIVARLFSGLTVLFLLIALVLDIISFFTPVKGALSSLDAFGSFVLGKLAIFVVAVILLVFLFITYSSIFNRLKRVNSNARDLSLIIGIILLVLGIAILGIFVTGAGILLLLAWLVLIL
ncbi:MAG: hypothetical protein M1306_02645 [Candidatus Thermoplasmatota archaeon]|jgi:hypothetical protein|nr:hypothetical protein [Candidatus Thermoplasmatota archaeon]